MSSQQPSSKFVLMDRVERAARSVSGQSSLWKRLAYYCGFAMGLTFILGLGIRFPQELAALQRNQEEIRKLQDENNNLRKTRDERREYLRNLKENPEALELEIRRSLDLHREDETIYKVPPKAPKSATPAK